jgi:hypothetical protein
MMSCHSQMCGKGCVAGGAGVQPRGGRAGSGPVARPMLKCLHCADTADESTPQMSDTTLYWPLVLCSTCSLSGGYESYTALLCDVEFARLYDTAAHMC